ncbi:hypothetical protein DL766_007829 [Monosporascus sp. MC13-8B]|uniref:HMG box domain-containing protein n=1 Tax=Monosporascus cannonballus TaxID=155416 RepID=A0ABY0H2P6_9PEZI|nr:hypothetical protein DL762_007744 [Monosporascus cannonballus]RYP21934.1 hypothetical protein DL766_007829 [Monosporascus sp. MC13-8B]
MSGNKGLSARDSELVAKAWRCLKTEPQIDFAKFAELCDYKNEATARASWSVVRKKLMEAAGAAPSGAAGSKRKAAGSKPVPQPAAKPAAAVAAALAASGDDTDDENKVGPSPSKKPRAPAAAAAGKGQGQGRGHVKGNVKGEGRTKKEIPAVQDDDIDNDLKEQFGIFVKSEPQGEEDDTPYGAA